VTTLLVVDRVLVRVAIGREARRGGEEILEGADVDCRVKYRDRERSGRWWGGGGDSNNGGSSDGRGDVLEGDIFN